MTRMWMVPPEIMCRNHLLGEHKEIHQLIGSLRKGYSVKGYILNNCIEIGSIGRRHDLLVTEMLRRGYTHSSPVPDQNRIDELAEYLPPAHVKYKVDAQASLADLSERCRDCGSG